MKSVSEWEAVKLEYCVQILDAMRVPINNTERQERIAGKSESELYPYFGATGEVGRIDGYLFDEELVALGEDGVPFLDGGKSKAYMLNGKTWVNNHAHVLKAIGEITSNRYLLHFLNQFDYQGYVNGGTRLKLTQANMRRIPMPLPPLAEQKQISAKLDELLAQVEIIKNHLDAIPSILKRFRQSVLAAAVIGRLTEEWRAAEENLVAPHSEHFLDKKLSLVAPSEFSFDVPKTWAQVRLGALVKLINGDRGKNYPNKNEYVRDGIPFINTGHIEPDGTLSKERMNYITKDKFSSLGSGKITSGDLVYCLRGATMGKTAISRSV